MSVQSGYIRVYRSLQRHQLWLAEPFTKGQAWLDLLMLAEWREDARGQVRHSLRFLAERWQWDKNRVDRFLEKLVKNDMVSRQKERKTGQGETLITIVNYESYQNGVEQNGTPVIRQRDTIRYANGTPSGHHFPYENDETTDAERVENGTPFERKSGQKEKEVKKTKNNSESRGDETACYQEKKVNVWAEWVDANRAVGRLDPTPAGQNTSAAKSLLTLIPDATERHRILKAFLADGDKWLTDQGHALRFLAGRIDKYRNTTSNAATFNFDDGIDALCDKLKREASK